MLFPVQSVTDLDSVIVNNDKYVALMKANLLMGLHFNIDTDNRQMIVKLLTGLM